MKKFDEVSENTKSIQCEFKQSKYLSISKEPLVSTGNLYFEDEKLRWEQKTPKDYVMCIKDDVLKIKEDGKIKKHSLGDNKYMTGLKEIMMGSMTGNLLKSNEFETELLENSTNWIVNLTPRIKRVKKMFSHIKMNFNRETYRMESVILTEQGGDYTRIEFLNPVFNKDISDQLFNL
ncbi:outer membrane lipoprotein carrier protein LolA [Crocinitomix catalasitica]|nr:outer membrane lipoprotein carrier protein LolA [Crocinitomix catalasitica]